MNKQADWVDYQQRLQRVITYIHDHLDDHIDLNHLADVACLSPYHWHRIYRAIQGETITVTIRRLRLHHAAGRLANTAMSLEEIAQRAGYGSVHAFTRAFSAAYGMPPATFRKSGSHTGFNMTKGETQMTDYPVEVKEIPAMALAAITHTGSYMTIGKSFEMLAGWLESRALFRPHMKMIAIYYDDPDTVAESELRSAAGVTVGQEFPLEPPLERIEIPGGPHAVLLHKGPYSDLRAAYQWFYGQWLPQSGREPANAPPFEEYLNSPRDTPPTDLLTAIHMPLR